MKAASPTAATTELPVPLRGLNPSPWLALFVLTLRQHVRGRRLFILILLFLLPAGLAILIKATDAHAQMKELEVALVYLLIPHALVPLTALLYASGMIQDEVEEQTLTYLLMRPIPRWTIYGVKLLGTLLVSAALTAVFTVVTFIALHWGQDQMSAAFTDRVWPTVAIYCLGAVSYGCIFGCISLFAKRSLVVGIAYIVLLEGLLSNIDFVVRHYTIMYYLRVLCERWTDLRVSDWSIDLSKAPDAQECVRTLLLASLATLVIGAASFASREFRVKTPEGS